MIQGGRLREVIQSIIRVDVFGMAYLECLEYLLFSFGAEAAASTLQYVTVGADK